MAKKRDLVTNCYEVEISAFFAVFVSEASSEEEAIELAQDELSMSITSNITEIRTRQLRESEVDSVRRHADERSEPR